MTATYRAAPDMALGDTLPAQQALAALAAGHSVDEAAE